MDTHKKPTLYDRYLIHQQGTQGAAEHVAYPQRIAWQSMCATDEGRQKGEKWCKRAIWKNTLPTIKQVWKSVDKLTSGAFVDMWRERMDHFYARYAQPDTPLPAVAVTPEIPMPMPRPAIMSASSTAAAAKAPSRRALAAVAMAQHRAAVARLSMMSPSSATAATASGKPTASVAHHAGPAPKPASATASILVGAKANKPNAGAIAQAQKPAARRLAATATAPNGGK